MLGLHEDFTIQKSGWHQRQASGFASEGEEEAQARNLRKPPKKVRTQLARMGVLYIYINIYIYMQVFLLRTFENLQVGRIQRITSSCLETGRRGGTPSDLVT